jgi:Type II secretion system (T2SS), protein G
MNLPNTILKYVATRVCYVALGILACVAGLAVLSVFDSQTGDPRMNRAIMDLKSLEYVVLSYKSRHDVFPDTLDELTVRDPVDNTPALLTEKRLIDSWGNRYLYDPSQLHPQSGAPLIWSNGPPDKNKPIKNWDNLNNQ